jgi:hypothetical protein
MVAPPPCLPQPGRHAVVMVGDLLPINALPINDLLQADGLMVADPPQDVLQPQAIGGREEGIDRPQ